MTKKTQLGMTFTNGKLNDIQFCNKDGCSAKFEKAELEKFNFSLGHYDEPMELRVMGKNTGNYGTLKVFDIAVYDRDTCDGKFLKFLPSLSLISQVELTKFIYSTVDNFCENGCPEHATCAGFKQCRCNEGWTGENDCSTG